MATNRKTTLLWGLVGVLAACLCVEAYLVLSWWPEIAAERERASREQAEWESEVVQVGPGHWQSRNLIGQEERDREAARNAGRIILLGAVGVWILPAVIVALAIMGTAFVAVLLLREKSRPRVTPPPIIGGNPFAPRGRIPAPPPPPRPRSPGSRP